MLLNMPQERRQQDSNVQHLIDRLDQHKEALENHTKLIAENHSVLEKVIESQSRMEEKYDKTDQKLDEHINEENETLGKVADFLRDLKGFDSILRYIGIGIKWFVLIVTAGGLLTFLWDKIHHVKVP